MRKTAEGAWDVVERMKRRRAGRGGESPGEDLFRAGKAHLKKRVKVALVAMGIMLLAFLGFVAVMYKLFLSSEPWLR